MRTANSQTDDLQHDRHHEVPADSSRIKQESDKASERTVAAASSPVRERIAIFLPTLDGGGAERSMVNLANAIADTDHTVDLVAGNAAGPFRDEISERVRLIDLGARRLLLAFPGLLRYLRTSRPDRLYAALEEANVLALLGRMIARTPTKVYVSIRNTLTCELRAKPTMKNITIVRLARHLYPFADGIIAVSENAADDGARLLGLPRERITVIPNPVITPELLAKASERVNHPWFAPGQPPVVVGCGRLVPEKDFALLIRAFALVRQVQPARLLILGEGPQRADLRLLASDLGVIEDTDLPGFDANPFRYMSRAAVFVLCSRHEGSPNVVVQALACGCPVVSTDSPGDSRRILSGAQATSLVPVGDAVALADAIRAFLRSDMCRPGPRLLPRFDYRSSAAAYLAIGHP